MTATATTDTTSTATTATMIAMAIERAKALAARRGVETRAQTLPGLMAALRRGPKREQWAAPPARPPKGIKSISLHGLIASLTSWQGRARQRRHEENAPLVAALLAALGVDETDTVGAVANCYGGRPMESVAAARRYGPKVLLVYGRAEMDRGPYGQGWYRIVADPWRVPYGCKAVLLDRREILQALAAVGGLDSTDRSYLARRQAMRQAADEIRRQAKHRRRRAA